MQRWYKDVMYAGGLKDEAGNPAFALVNKATGDALKHSLGYHLPVSQQLCLFIGAIVPYFGFNKLWLVSLSL